MYIYIDLAFLFAFKIYFYFFRMYTIRIGKDEYNVVRNINCDSLEHWRSTQSYKKYIDIQIKSNIKFYITKTKRQMLISNYPIKRKRYPLSKEPEQGLACLSSTTESIQYPKMLNLKLTLINHG